jgi:glycosyltransferase involved in cell wall biosynthesis
MTSLEETRPGRSTTTGARAVVGIDLTPVASDHGIRGIGRYVRGIASALVEERPEWTGQHLAGLALQEGMVPEALRTWRATRPVLRPQDVGWLWAIAADRLAIRNHAPEIWHATDPGTPFSPLGSRRSVVTVYDLIPLHEAAVMARIRPHRRLVYQAYLRQVRRAAFVIAISQATAEDVERTLRVPPERIRVVYPAIRPLAALRLDLVAKPAQPVELLFVGVPDPHKRAALAIDSLAAYRLGNGEARLTFVGYIPPGVRAELLALARRAGVGSSVAFLDRVSDDELARLYESTILLALSRIEGFGLPPVEAILSGGRVVAVPTAIYRETLGGLATFADDASPVSVARAITESLSSGVPDATAIARLADRFSPRRAADTLVATYEEALASAARGFAKP